MAEKTTATAAVAMEREEGRLRAVALRYSHGSIVCEKLIALDGLTTTTGAINPLTASQEGKKLLSLCRKELVVSAVEGSQTLIRSLEVQLQKEKDIEETLSFQVEPLLPYNAEEVVLGYENVWKQENGSTLTVEAVHHDHLQTHLDQWHAWEIEPEVITSEGRGLATFINGCGQQGSVLCIHIGLSHTTLALVHDGKLLASQPLKMGYKHLVAARRSQQGVGDEAIITNADLKDVDAAKLDVEGHTPLERVFANYCRELRRLSLALQRSTRQVANPVLCITGELTDHPSFPQAIAKAIEKPLTWGTVQRCNNLDEQQAHRFALPIGMALTALPLRYHQTDFRQEAFAYPHPWKRLRWPLTLSALCCVGLAVAMWLLGNSWVELSSDGLRNKYVEVLQAFQRDYASMEKAMGNVIEQGEGDVPDLRSLSVDQLARRISSLEEELAKAPSTIALFPNTPRVSDFLAWLGNHPLIATKNGKGSSPLHIESLSYKMVSRPELAKPRDKYQVLVEMEISSKSFKAARLFYDSLIAPNDIVDPRTEVKWTAGTGKYRVAFILKDRTIYPTQP